MKTVFLTIMLMLLPLYASAADQRPAPSPYDLYQQVLSGKLKLNDLSPQQKREVLTIHGILSRPSCGNYKGKCAEACESKAELERAANNLARCAKNADLTEDCEIQFMDTRDAFEEYESKISEVADYCS